MKIHIHCYRHNSVHQACLCRSLIMRNVSAVVVALLTATTVMATEGGGSQYAIGVETNFSGLMLPEGFHQFIYYSHYDAKHSKDNSGNDNPRLAYFKVRSDAIATRLSYVWSNVKFLGANVETRAAIAIPTLNVSLGIARPSPLKPLDRSGTQTGLGDLSLAPVLLGWHSPTFHQTAGSEFFLPVGNYDVLEPVNTGRNYYSIAPFYAVTWFPSKGIDVSSKVRVGFNGKNKDTNYRSGNELTVEFSGSVRVNESLALGLSGYVYQQISDDKQNGVSVNGNGNRGRVQAIGPSLTYNFTPQFAVIAKLQQEFNAVNRPQGTRLWLQTKIPF
jgi:hypothetical protein